MTPRSQKPHLTPSGVGRLALMLQLRKQAGQSRKLQLLAVIAVTVLLLGSIAWPFTHAHLQSVAVLDLVADKPLPSWLRLMVSEPVVTQELTLPTANGPIPARLYTPKNHPGAPAVVVLHGVHHLGMNEPRLIAFASAMASCGLRVLTPELPDIKDYHVGANSIATIGDSAAWMAQRNGGSVGVMGLSFSGGLSLLAASDSRWAHSIRFVVAIGSQDEMSRVAAYYRTGQDLRPNGTTELLPPHEYGALVLEYEHLEDFAPAANLTALRAVLRAHLYEDGPAEKVALARLNPAQQTEIKQLLDTTNPATRAALAHSETLHIEDMAGVSPHGHLNKMTTPVYLLHGEGDNIIPSAETQWMASELPGEALQSELISPVLSHINLDGVNPSAMDQLRLVHFFALILNAAEK